MIGNAKQLAELVGYANQKLDDKSNEEKYKYAADEISKKFPRLDSQEVEHMIESAVGQ